MKQEELKLILENHKHYLRQDVDGWEGMRANLENADLRGADLVLANLKDANLFSADLEGANLLYADLEGADLRDANLKGASLRKADLFGADLRGANLIDANLDDTYFNKKEEYRKGVILSKSIVGWKKCAGGAIVELEIPKGAIVFCINGKKCRTNKAKVISISNGDKGISGYNSSFIYEVGKSYEIEDFNLQYNVECGTGIHFFKNRADAVDY